MGYVFEIDVWVIIYIMIDIEMDWVIFFFI